MRSFLFKFSVLKSLKTIDYFIVFYRYCQGLRGYPHGFLLILRIRLLNSLHFRNISYIREVMNHVGMDHITDQSDAAVSMILLYNTYLYPTHRIHKKRPAYPPVSFCTFSVSPNLLRCSPQPSPLWLPLPSPVHRKEYPLR